MQDLISIIQENSYSVVEVAPIQLQWNIAHSYYEDARSAAFYAMGEAVKSQKSVTLIISGKYLENIYTAITEAWFQKANIVVVALFEFISEVKNGWMDRCVLKNITIGTEETELCKTEFKNAYLFKGPVLINLISNKIDHEALIDYSPIICGIRTADNKAVFYCYNSMNSGISNIPEDQKYGCISKYVGQSLLESRGYLLCNSSCFMVDINIFRTRYANGNMKIVCLDDGSLRKYNIPFWIRSNGWECLEAKENNANIYEWLVSQKKQSVLIIE